MIIKRKVGLLCQNSEVEEFLDNLHYLKIKDKIIAIGKDVPILFEFLSHDLISKKKCTINDKLIKDYSLLKRFGYIPQTKIIKRPLKPTAALSLHISHDCNMACEYCFIKKGMSYSRLKLMSPEIARRAVDFFYKHTDQKIVTVIFIGGEPLLNLPAIEAALEEIKNFPNYDTDIIIVTNGTLLKREIAQFLHKNKIKIIISYDGIKEEHDRKRILKNGNRSSQIITDNIDLLGKLGIEIEAIKATIARDSPYSFMDYIENLIRLPVHPRKIRLEYEYSFPPRPWRKNLIAQRLKFFNWLKEKMQQGVQFQKLPLNGRLTTFHAFVYPKEKFFGSCGFSKNKVLVTPEGNFYFCDLVINRHEFYVGNIEQGVDEDKLAALKESFCFKFDSCKDCWVKSFCDFHCPYAYMDGRYLADSCALTRTESKKILEIFLGLNLEDILSLYTYSSIPERLKATITKWTNVGYRLRTMVREKTTVLKPLNILPICKENV